jgi:flagellar hook protein FlgE
MSFEIALTGINAINTQLETISNNIANTGTYGYKSGRANFASMYAGTQPTGVVVSSVTQSLDIGGSVLTTGRALDVAISGKGYFATKDTTGETLFTRVGVFSTDADGFVVDGFGRKLQGYAAVEGSTALGAFGDLAVTKGQIAAKASSTLDYVANLSADWTTPAVAPFDPTDAQTFNSSAVSVAYDSLGVQHTVTQYFVHSNTNEVTVHYAFDGAILGTTSTLQFGTDGALTSPASAVSVALGTPTGADAMTLAVDYTGTTQYAGATTTTVNSTDGYASGVYTGVNIEDDGSVMAQYSNGEKKQVGTVALATFPNEDKLVAVSDTSWTISNESGEPLYNVPGTGVAGTLTAGALEQSNVDLTSQLVSLMTAQRNYQANTKVFSTQNAMMQSLMQSM